MKNKTKIKEKDEKEKLPFKTIGFSFLDDFLPESFGSTPK
jgi:hypothetical protein